MVETGIPSSFIPQDATQSRNARRYESGGLGDLFRLLSIVLFIASVALAVAAFLYQQYLNQQSASKLAQIQRAEADVDPTLIQQLTRLDDRMNAAETLLKAHIAPSAFFSALNQSTLTTVSFSQLEFTASDPSAISVKMSGVAQSVNSIALQSQLFSQNGIITNPIFSGIDRQADGVHFSVAASVNPAAINYETVVTGQAPSGVNQLPAVASTTQAQQSQPSFEGPTSASQQAAAQ